MLFGHQDDLTNMPHGTMAKPTASTTAPNAAGSGAALTVPVTEQNTSAPSTTPVAPSAPALDSDNPLADETTDKPDETPEDQPSEDKSADTPSSPQQDTATSSTDDSDLLNLKRQALNQLSPLVDQLDQTPEEKFRTTMMMIQSTDNEALLSVAYEAAQNIAEDKARAQALLDVINEINYFTQQKK